MVEANSKPEQHTPDEPYALPGWKRKLSKITRNLKGIFGFAVIAAVLIVAAAYFIKTKRQPAK